MKTMFWNPQRFHLHYVSISYPCRVFHQSGFLCTGFLQLVVILTPLVFPAQIFSDSILFFKKPGFLQLVVPLTPLVFPDERKSDSVSDSKKKSFYNADNYCLTGFPSIIFWLYFLTCFAPPLLGCRNQKWGDNCCETVSAIRKQSTLCNQCEE